MSKYEIKEMIDNLIFSTFNLISQISFSVSRSKTLVKKNDVFKNKHAGERCLILGTGPSLSDVDLSFIKDEIIFGVNFLYKSDIIKQIKPQYYCLYDEIFHGKNIDDTRDVFDKLPETTFFVRTKTFKNFERNGLLRNNVYFQSCNVFQHGDYIKVDMTKNMTAPYNVVLGCIQTAIYMGFKEIYLLGCDYNSFAALKVEHFYDDKNQDAPSRHMSLGYEMKFYTMVTYHHYALEKYAKKNNIKIYNVTNNSLLDAYERKNYLDVFQLD